MIDHSHRARHRLQDRKNSKTLIACLLFTGSICALSASADTETGEQKSPGDSWTFTFLFENDLFGDTDAQYTNGIKLGWLSPDLRQYDDSEKLPRWVVRVIKKLPFINEPNTQHNVGFAIGQLIFTPEDTQARAVVLDDRPYAGWLYGSIAFVSKSEIRLDTLEVQAGLIGPASLAEQAQSFVHDVRGFPSPNGWKNQLENEPGLAFIYERKWRALRSMNASGFGYDLITHLGGAVGNVFTYLNAGAEARIGWNLPADFGTSLIRPGGESNAPTAINDPRLNNQQPYGVHAFAAVTGLLPIRDIFLDGNTFRDSHSVDKELLVGDLVIGIAVLVKSIKLSYAQVIRTQEFKEQHGTHKFGSVSFSLTF